MVYKLSEATGFSANAIRNSVKEYASKRRGINEEPAIGANENVHVSLDTSKFDKEHRRMAIAEYTVLKQMFLSSEAIAFYEQNIKYFNDERYRSIANFLVEQNANGQSTDINDIISLIQLAELPNSEALVNIVSGLALSKESEYSITVLRDCYRVILEERSKIHDRYTLKKALEGKSPQEQARIVNDLVSRKKI